MQAAHSVQARSISSSCDSAREHNVCNISSVCLPYVYHNYYGYQSSCSAIYTCNHPHTILDVSVSYIDAIDC